MLLKRVQLASRWLVIQINFINTSELRTLFQHAPEFCKGFISPSELRTLAQNALYIYATEQNDDVALLILL